MIFRKNSGLTLIGFLIVLVIALFFAYAGMKTIPMYLEYHALKNALSTLQDDPGSASLQPGKIKNLISRRLWVSYASNNIKPSHMHISKVDGGLKVRVAYEIRESFLGNIDIIGKFDTSVVLSR